MNILHLNLKGTTAEPQLLQAGVYKVACTKATFEESKKGNPKVVFTLNVLSEGISTTGAPVARGSANVYENFMLTTEDQHMDLKRTIAAAIAKCAGAPLDPSGAIAEDWDMARTVENIRGKTFEVAIGITDPEPGYPERNKVTRWIGPVPA